MSAGSLLSRLPFLLQILCQIHHRFHKLVLQHHRVLQKVGQWTAAEEDGLCTVWPIRDGQGPGNTLQRARCLQGGDPLERRRRPVLYRLVETGDWTYRLCVWCRSERQLHLNLSRSTDNIIILSTVYMIVLEYSSHNVTSICLVGLIGLLVL